jgi:hypothetical protein
MPLKALDSPLPCTAARSDQDRDRVYQRFKGVYKGAVPRHKI